jgi:pyruvate/2-oxoglutarate dehydrogenase complex dihydrolipoamide dehydrogenase (E3) component
MFADDKTGSKVIDALIRAQQRGVVCRVLIDHFSNVPFNRPVLKRLRTSGIAMHQTLPVRIFDSEWSRLDLRNHRKIVVVDGQVGFTGSQNLVDRDYHKRRNIKKGLYYIELVARVMGPVVSQLDAVFRSDWYAETRVVLDRTSAPEAAVTPNRTGDMVCQVLPSGPAFENDNNLAIIIGAGQAGVPLATTLAKAGYRTAIVEREHVGGTCVNEGCYPSKTMIASGRVAYLARRAADYGVHTGPVTVNLAEVRQRKRAIVERLRSGSEQYLDATAGLDLMFGQAYFSGPQTLEVQLNSGGMRTIAAELIFINTGARPAMPVIEGIDSVRTLNSTTIMELERLPEHLLILGGGYIGLEFAQLFRRFGSQVTIVQCGPQLLAREDDDVADAVAAILREDGVEVLFNTAAMRVGSNGSDSADLTVYTPGGARILRGSHLLVAAGRAPNTEYLRLEAAGVQVDARGFIAVNERLETNVPGVYALGDVNGGPAFTHIAYDDFRIIRANLLEGGNVSTAGRLVPYTVFIDPQLGRVGLSEQAARAQGRSIRVAKLPMSRPARARALDEMRGFMKAIVDAETNQILGAAILGGDGGEVLAVLQMAMLGRLPYPVLREAVFAHPTLAESLNNLFMATDE